MNEAKLETGTSLTLQLRSVQIQASQYPDGWIGCYLGKQALERQQPCCARSADEASLVLLQLSWQMDRLLPGAMKTVVVTAVPCKIS